MPSFDDKTDTFNFLPITSEPSKIQPVSLPPPFFKDDSYACHVNNTNIPTKSEKVENLKEGSLLVVTVGNKDFFPSASDLKMVGDLMKETFKDSVGVKVVVVPQAVKIEKLSLPQLRSIINEVIVAPEESKDKYDPIINMDL